MLFSEYKSNIQLFEFDNIDIIVDYNKIILEYELNKNDKIIDKGDITNLHKYLVYTGHHYDERTSRNIDPNDPNSPKFIPPLDDIKSIIKTTMPCILKSYTNKEADKDSTIFIRDLKKDIYIVLVIAEILLNKNIGKTTITVKVKTFWGGGNPYSTPDTKIWFDIGEDGKCHKTTPTANYTNKSGVVRISNKMSPDLKSMIKKTKGTH